MKKTIIFFLSFYLICNGGIHKNIFNKKSISCTHDTIIDYAINDIGINEYNSIKNKLGNKVLNQIRKSASKNIEVWAQAQILNRQRNKYFRLVLQDGSSCCQYFEVEYNSKKNLGQKNHIKLFRFYF